MRFASVLLTISLLLAASACGSTSTSQAKASPAVTAPAAQTAGAKAPETRERPGVFVPAEYEAVSIWPEAYSGELVVLEVLPHGSTVAQGDVIARLETRSIDELGHQADLETRSATVRHEAVVAKNAIDDDAAAASLEQARASLERARRTLEGWTKSEVSFAKRSDEIGKKYEAAGIDDQKDELAQLEKMYSGDELVDATEEIVLKRSKRRLAISEESQNLSGDRRVYRVEHDEAMQTEIKQEAVKTQELAFDRLKRTQDIERRARQDALARSADALRLQTEKLSKLKRDQKLLTLLAPRAGVLLHGKEKDYRPGRTPARYERGSQLSFRGDLFLVAAPDALAVALEVPESMLKNVREGVEVEVRPVATSEECVKGTIHLQPYPSANAGGEESLYEARVGLADPLPGVRFGARAKVAIGLNDGAAVTVAGP